MIVPTLFCCTMILSRVAIIQRHHNHRKFEPQIPREPCRSQSGIQDDSRAWSSQSNAARQMASGTLSSTGEGKRAESLEKMLLMLAHSRACYSESCGLTRLGTEAQDGESTILAPSAQVLSACVCVLPVGWSSWMQRCGCSGPLCCRKGGHGKDEECRDFAMKHAKRGSESRLLTRIAILRSALRGSSHHVRSPAGNLPARG